eukprot:2418728-Amphidinium_carterae.3
MAMQLLFTIAILNHFAVFTTDVVCAFLNTPIDNEVFVQPPQEYYYNNNPHILWRMTKALYSLRTPKQWQEHLNTILQQLGFQRLTSDACVFADKQSTFYTMAYVDDLLVV